jgi:hypothetical protein
MTRKKSPAKVAWPRKPSTSLDEAAKFLERIFKPAHEQVATDFYIEFRFIREINGEKEVNFLFCHYEDIRATLPEVFRRNGMDFNGMDFNVYYGPNPRSGPARGKKKYIEWLASIWVDLDAEGSGRKRPAPYKTVEDALKAIEGFSIQPSVIKNSGRGIQALWILDKPVPCQGAEEGLGLQAEQIMRGLAKELKGDDVSDISRVLRLPGTINHKHTPKVVSRCLTDLDGEIRTYSLEDFDVYKDTSHQNLGMDDDNLDYEGEDLSSCFKETTGKRLEMAVERLKISDEMKNLIKEKVKKGEVDRSRRDIRIINALIHDYADRRFPYNWATVAAIFSNPNLGCNDRTREKRNLVDIKRCVQKALVKREQREENNAVREQVPEVHHARAESELTVNNDFLNLYVESIAEVSDVPRIFSLFSGITLLSGILNKLYFLFPKRTHLNLYILLLAPSTYYRKTTAVEVARDYLHRVNPGLLLPSSFTPEALYEILSEQNRGLICWRELIQVKDDFGKDYNKGLSSFLTDIYDYTPVWKRKTKGGGLVEIEEPVVTILSAGVKEWLLKNLDERDFQGGFWTRTLFVPCDEDQRPYNFPREFEGLNQQLVTKLEELDDLEPQKIELTEIISAHTEWGERHQREALELESGILQAVYQRLEVMLLKVAAIFQLSHDHSMTIAPEIYEEAVKVIEFLKRKLLVFFKEEIRFSPVDRARVCILRYIKKKTQECGEAKHREVLQNTGIASEIANKAIDQLLQEGEIEVESTNVEGSGRIGRAYKWIDVIE